MQVRVMKSIIHAKLSALTCEHWLMLLALALFILALRCPTGRGVTFTSRDDVVSCVPLTGHCGLRLSEDSSSYFPVRRIVDETYLQSLERRLIGHFNRSGFSLIRPSGCDPAYRTAIVVPYRDRAEHLNLFVQHIHDFLAGQGIAYALYVIEQSKGDPFNRGMLFNVGFREALKDAGNFCCFIFHDVDLLPENPQNAYVCSSQPRHMCVGIDTFRYVVPYANIFGGVVAMQRQHVEKVNGFSNRFWGWGGEDDDLALRIRLCGLTIFRWPPHISRYTMMGHKKEMPNPDRFALLAESEAKWRRDGLSDLRYEVLAIHRNPLFTRITVRLHRNT
ncbi:beta-1 [Tropilaelaps mercedesae]|uniref:Beta-1,4-N-acetylgalactosaminyltransferase n=1 Tax=Tropilaelaps mercedesae TaxID=418985 RepID=A0A1V9XIA6_9ACAR|nr:beta-1 [Tropilaelaps mercedesae]